MTSPKGGVQNRFIVNRLHAEASLQAKKGGKEGSPGGQVKSQSYSFI